MMMTKTGVCLFVAEFHVLLLIYLHCLVVAVLLRLLLSKLP